jgi:cell shape-determining protein MreC
MRFRTTWTKRRSLLLALAVSVLTIVMGPGAARSLRNGADFLLAPAGEAPMYAATALKGLGGEDQARQATREEVEQLRIDNAYLQRLAGHWKRQEEIQKRRAEELANFQALYRPASDLACELIPARVVGQSGLPYHRSRMLRTPLARPNYEGSPVTMRTLLTDRAKSLPPKLAVVTGSVLVGRIDEAGAYTARLRLVTDRGFEMAGHIRRNIDPAKPRMVTVTEGDAAVAPLTPENNKEIEVNARGDGSAGMIVEYVKAYHNVLAGDLLVTSGEEAFVPTEINVGVVTEVRPDAKDPHRSTLRVRPHADLDSLREVFVIVPLGAGGQ